MMFQQRVATALERDFQIERTLGSGAMATVFLARDLKHNRWVALKVLRPELALAIGPDRFLREIRMAARLSHPGILPLFDSGETAGLLYYTMPYVEGDSLRQRLRQERRLPVEEAVRIAIDVARALAYAHERGVVHRDIKPENILLEKGEARVVDFGIGLALEESDAERLTHTGVVIGTPAYMSPEQGAGSATLDHRTDIYSLGCVLYEMLAGEPPFEAPTVQATIVSQMVDPPPRLRKSRPVVPLGIEATVERALAKEPAERFRSATEFAEALLDPLRRPWWPLRRLSRRMRRTVTLASIGLVTLVSAGLLVARMPSGSRDRPHLRERDFVLVGDVEGPKNDATLAAAVRELVTTELNQSRFMTTMPRSQVAGKLRELGYPDTSFINVDLAKELAFRSQVRAVVLGRIDSTRSGYALSLRVVDPDGNELASSSGSSSADEIIPTVQRVSRRLREQLGERREDLATNQTLLDIATPSLPAYRRYVEALERRQHGDLSGSTGLIRSAIALDSGFVSGWIFLGQNYLEAREIDSARIAYAKALEHPSRLTPLQRYRLLADAAYTVDHDLPAAIRWYDKYLELMPRSVGGFNNRGFYLSMLGRYDEALADFERSIENNPFGPSQGQPQLVNATDMLLTLGRLDRARAKAHDLIGPYASFAQIRMLTATGHWTDAESLAVRLLGAETTTPPLHVEAITTRAAALAARGSVAEADRVLESEARTASDAQRRWYEQARSLLALASGLHPQGLGSVPASDSSPGAHVVRAIGMALRGDTAGARRERRSIDRLAPAQRSRLSVSPVVIDGLLDGAAGHWDRVIARLADKARSGEHDGADLDHVPSVTMRWIVADAYGHLGQLDSAVSFMRAALRPERIPPGHHALRGLAWAFGMRKLAFWESKLGDREGATRDWAAFKEAFTAPDPILRSLLVQPTFVVGSTYDGRGPIHL
jgi:serine/threonine protein kinase/tetratricopeptide (TPR) repeat protein